MADPATVLVCSVLCGIVTFCIAWMVYKRNSGSKNKLIYSRQAVLEATNKRLNDLSASSSIGAIPSQEQNQDLACKDQELNFPLKETKRNYGAGDDREASKESRTDYKISLSDARFSMTNDSLDPKTSLPISQPLKTLAEVYGWIPGFDHFNVATRSIRSVKPELPKKPKTLVCHDMRGGYTEDRFVQGYDSTTCYRIHHWNFIDTFVYFSHNMVTIPPPCWTNAGHTHGVKVLGTFITEWDDGAKSCADILETKQSYQRFAKQLVDISCYYNFDGWLINIENSIAASQLDNLVGFVSFLTKAMHKAKPGSEIIWYDSVTNTGQLQWQNELNRSNSVFFDACDGIFLNYTWSIHNLSRSAIVAGDARRFDVYVGIDVFGRGCFGSGGWNTYKAMQVAREHNLSVAIFAPGWVLETQGPDKFTKSQNKFWHLLMSYLYPHVVQKLPLVSAFCQGYGDHFFCNGVKLLNLPWTNLSCQELQPTYFDEYYQLGPKEGFEIKNIAYCTEDAFKGGGCQMIDGIVNTHMKASRAIFRLFRCCCPMQKPLFVSLTFKVDKADLVEIYLLLLLEQEPNYLVLGPANSDAEKQTIDSVGEKLLEIGTNSMSSCLAIDNHTYDIPKGQNHNYKFFEPLTAKSHGIAEKQCTADAGVGNGWQSRYYMLSEENMSALKEIRIACKAKISASPAVSTFKLMVGEIKVMNARELFPKFPTFTNIRTRDTVIETKADGKLLSTTIMWDCAFEQDGRTLSLCCDVFCKGIAKEGHCHSKLGVFLGRAFVDSYRVAHLKVADESLEGLEFVIQPVSQCNIRAPRDQCATCTLTW